MPARGNVAEKSRSKATFSADERAAMRERARELKAQALKADGLTEVVDKIAAMSEPDRSLGRRLHELITAAVPGLAPRTWYGMPAYALDGSIVCFFKPAEKFGTRYATVGFSDKAKLDDANMWPTEYAVTKLTPADERRLSALVRRAAG